MLFKRIGAFANREDVLKVTDAVQNLNYFIQGVFEHVLSLERDGGGGLDLVQFNLHALQVH